METNNLCLECDPSIRGKCCRWVMIIDNIKTRLPHMKCPFLSSYGWCTIYPDRHKLNPYCLTVKQFNSDL